ncbi:hypothetical protein LJC59_09670, partial [Desulfovibrio sp. OttesenSCG-928-A18]|nr:hypothetical protein [Desulfovibrio sp. OttesenSCG-928-A18]
IIPLSLFFLLQTIFTLDARELWFSDEIRHAAAFQNLLEHGKGLILEMNGQPYPDKPPLYFWFLRGLYELLRTDGPMLHFTAVAISGLLYLWAALGLGSMAARVDKRSNLAAGLILLSTGYIMGSFHYARMDLLFAALIICSQIALYRAFVSPENNFAGMVTAFVFAGLATLVKGPLGLAMPVCAIVLFAIWRGTREQLRCVVISLFALICGLLPPLIGLDVAQMFKLLPQATELAMEWGALALALAPPALILLLLALLMPRLRLCVLLSFALMLGAFVLVGGTPYFKWPLMYALPVLFAALFALWQACPQRLFRLDFHVGLLAGLIVSCAWLALIYQQTGKLDFILNDLLKVQVLERAADTFHHKESWYYYLLRLPLMFLPWTLLLFFLPWNGFMGKGMREGLAASRTPQKEGIAFLWSMVISAVLLLSALSGKILIYFLPAAPALCLLMARAILGLADKKAKLFRYGMAILLFVAAVLLVLVSLVLFDVLPAPGIDGLPNWIFAANSGFFIAAAIIFAAAGMLWFGLGSSRPEGVLLVLGIFATILSYPVAGLVAPTFDAVLSPKKQALIMRAYIQQGYTPATFNDYPGTYTFYAGADIPRLASLDEAQPLAEKGKFVLALRSSELAKWDKKPECLTLVDEQWIETRQLALLACPAIADLAPAQVPYKPAPDIWGSALKLVGLEKLFAPKQETPAGIEKSAPAETPEVEAAPKAPEVEAVPKAPDAGAVPKEALPDSGDKAPDAPAPGTDAKPAPEPDTDAAPESGPDTDAKPAPEPRVDAAPVTEPGSDDAPAPGSDAAPAADPDLPGSSAPAPDADGTPPPAPDADGTPPSASDADGTPSADPDTSGAPVPVPDASGAPEPGAAGRATAVPDAPGASEPGSGAAQPQASPADAEKTEAGQPAGDAASGEEVEKKDREESAPPMEQGATPAPAEGESSVQPDAAPSEAPPAGDPAPAGPASPDAKE